jgi:hypothetical protein
MLFAKTALPYSRLRDDGVIDYVVLSTKIEIMMITFHIALTSLSAQTSLRFPPNNLHSSKSPDL